MARVSTKRPPMPGGYDSKIARARMERAKAGKQKYEALVYSWAKDTIRLMFADLTCRPMYFYYRPSDANNYGALASVLDGDTPPDGYELVCAEQIRKDRTPDQLYAWAKRYTDRLPMYPSREEMV